jgi:anti-anti-sigma regulatory factor
MMTLRDGIVVSPAAEPEPLLRASGVGAAQSISRRHLRLHGRSVQPIDHALRADTSLSRSGRLVGATDPIDRRGQMLHGLSELNEAVSGFIVHDRTMPAGGCSKTPCTFSASRRRSDRLERGPWSERPQDAAPRAHVPGPIGSSAVEQPARRGSPLHWRASLMRPDRNPVRGERSLNARCGSFSVEVVWVGGATAVVFLRGDVDLVTAPVLAECLESIVARVPRRVVLDLAEVTLLDMAGASEIEHARGCLALYGGVCAVILRQPRPIVRKALELAGLDNSCVIED